MLTSISIPKDVSLVVLDLDGTLYRKPRMAWYMIRSQWRHLPSLAAERRYRRLLRRRLALDTANTPAKTVTREFSDKWYNESYLPAMVRVIARHYKAEPWVQPLLDDCHTRGVKVALLSDYEAAVDKLRVLRLNPDDFDCILSTGDLGTMDKNGHIFIRGRSKNMLLGANGQNIYPEEIEDKLNSMAMVSESLVVQRDNRLIALVYPDSDEIVNFNAEDLADIMEQNRQQLNEMLPAYSRITAIELQEQEFAKTPKKSIKRYLYN